MQRPLPYNKGSGLIYILITTKKSFVDPFVPCAPFGIPEKSSISLSLFTS
jgi:hypothetical protein